MATQQRESWRNRSFLLVLPLICSCANHGVESLRPGTTEEVDNSTDSHAHQGHVHHGIDYIEFTVTDMVASKRFYAAAFGWKFSDYGPEYAGIERQGGESGGLRLETSNSTGGPLVILYSSNLETTLTKVREAGGRIIKEPFTFPGGRRFHFEDPSGNELAVWSEG